VQAELIRRIAAVEEHLQDLRRRLDQEDTLAQSAYAYNQRNVPNLFTRAWHELSEDERNNWRYIAS